MQPAPGSLLIASATLLDPHFARCLLVVLDANDEGALAVILNQPSETEVVDVLPGWQDLTTGPSVFFRGGPVERNAALAVGSLAGTLVGALTLGVVNKMLEPYAGAVLAKVFVLVAIMLFIQRRPRGLFALKGRAAES